MSRGVWLLVLGLAVAVFGGVYVFEGGSPVGYVVVDGVRVYLVNSSVSLFVDYGGNITVVYCGGVLRGVGPGVWFNVSLSSLSIFEVYVDGVLVDRFAVKPARTSHNPFVTDLTLNLSKTRVVRGEVVSARLSWVRHSWCPADFVKVLARGRDGSVYELGRFRWPYWELVMYGAESKSVSFVVDLPPGVYEVKAVACSCHGTASYFDPGWGDVCYDGGFKGRSPGELGWSLYEAASPVVNLTVLPTELDLLRWAAVHGLDAKETNRLLSSFGLEPYVEEVERRNTPFVRFVLKNGSTVEVPVFFEVQSDGTGFFVVGNPSWVRVAYVAVAKFSRGGVGGELRFNLTVSPLDAEVLAPAVFRGGDGEADVSLFLYVPPGVYSLGNFSVVFERERLVAGNRSILLRWLHAVFLPPEAKRLVDAVGWCNSAFWKAFDEVADPYDYSLLGDVVITVIPVGKIAGFFGKYLSRGAEASGVLSAVKAAVYALSSSKWARAVGSAAGYVLPDVFIAMDIQQHLDPAAAEEVFSAFDVDVWEVERFHAGVLTESTCRNAGRYYAAVYVSWVSRISTVVDLASNLYAKVSKDALERFGRSIVTVAEGARRFTYGTHAAYIAARGWGPHDVDDKTWDDAFSKLAEALTGRKDVATVVQLSRMGIISDREGVLEGYVITGKKGGYTQAEGFDAYVKSFGGRDVYFVTPGEEGGGFLVGFSDDKSLYRWTNYGFFDKLWRFGFVKDLNIVERGKGEVSVRGFKTRYSCVEVSFAYHPEYINTIQDLLTRGLSADARAAVLAQWRQRFAVIAVFHSLDAALRNRIKYYAYEVDIPSPSEIGIMNRLSVAGLVGFLRQNNRFIYEYEFPKVAIHLPGRRPLGAPDGIALFEEGKVKGIYHLEVGSTFDYALKKYLDRTWDWAESNVVSACGGGVCLTQLGVALVGFRTDAVGGATVGAMAAGPVADHVKAYPQIKTSLVEWADLLNREAVVRPVIGDYQEVGHGAYRLRLLVLEKATLINDDMREAALKAWASCWK